MKKMKNNKGFTLVELLAVIVVLAIVMGIAAVAITNVLDSTRKNAYVATAKQFITGAKSLVNADEVEIMMGGTGTYAPKCQAPTGNADAPVYNSKTIGLYDIRTEGNDNDKSPYGNQIKKGATGSLVSYVKVEAIYDSSTGTCTYDYSIFITDDIYSIGTSASPIKEVDLGSDDVKAQKGY